MQPNVDHICLRQCAAGPIVVNQVVYLLADDKLGGDCGSIPHWVFPEGDARMQRNTPILLPRGAVQTDTLRQALAVYRMVFGQPLLDFILLRAVSDIAGMSLAPP